jgi:DNA polymerase-3 subunit delta'
VSWQRIRGHDLQKQGFERAWQRGRLAHAYLFVGPVGVGKHLFAVELAKALFCLNAPAGRLEACDHCNACSQVEAGTHPDCFTARRPEDSLELPIDVMREFCDKFSLKSATGKGKVAILDDADDLNEESANCFLKTLEEPPPRSVLILIGTSVERQLPTIVSRCQVVRFAPLPDEVVIDLLRGEGVADEKLLPRLARLSGGSPGQARALADPDLWAFRQTFLASLAQRHPESVALAKSLTEFVEEAGKESGAQRRRAGLVLRLLIEFLDDALRLGLGGTPRLAEPEDTPLLQMLADRLDPERLLEVLDRCLEGDMHIDRRVQLVMALEALLDALGQKLLASG